MIWSDAFTFGCMVWSATGAAGAQTLLIVDARANNTACNATVTHTSGSGKLWIVPAAMKRNQTSHSQFNYTYGWPVGLFMPCASGMSPPLNCTSSFDEGNTYESSLVGRWVAGNNDGGSISIGDSFVHNYRYDILEGGSVGSTYIGTTANSYENSNSPSPIVGRCETQNYSVFIGEYGAVPGTYYCLTPTDLYGGALGTYGTSSTSPVFLASMAGSPTDIPIIATSKESTGVTWNLPLVINQFSAFGSLPTCDVGKKGAHQFISDGAASPVFSANAAGGGSLFTPVYCDGNNWKNG